MLSVRPFFASVLVFLPAAAVAQSSVTGPENVSTEAQATTFQLGGAATLAARVEPETEEPRASRLSLPLGFVRGETVETEIPLGIGTVFLSEGFEQGSDALEVGTFLSRGQARAGVSFTYRETDPDLARSEVFLDYAVTEQFSIGLSGILDNERDDEDAVRQLGVNAEFSTSGGAFVQGGVAGAADYNPIIGLSVGLRF